MAQLPDSTALGERPTPQPATGVASYEPPNWRQVGMAGQIISSAGADLRQAANTVAAASDHQDQQVALDAANRLNAARLNLEQDPTNGFANAKGNAVVGPQFVQRYSGQFGDAQSNIADTLTNNNQKRLFQQHAEVLGLQFQSALLQHQAKQTTLFNATTRDDTINLGLNDIAAHPYDDATHQTNQLLMGKTVVDAGKDMGLSGDALANFVRVGTTKLESKALVYRTSGMLLDNPMKAADFFRQHELEFDPQDRMHLAGALKTAVDAQTSRIGGQQAYQAAIGTPSASPLPENMNADTVKPYDAARIGQIVDQVKAPSPYDSLISKWAQAYNVSPTELKLRMVAESGGNKDAVSSQGAIGLMQFTPDTAKAIGIDPKDPEQSIIGAAILMSKAGGTIGGDMGKVDRTYYGGNADAKGPNTAQYVENMRAVRQRIFGASQPVLTQATLEGAEGRVIDNAKAVAQQQRPGDMVYQDQVIAEARKSWANSLASVRGTNEQTLSNIMGLFASDTPPKAIGDLPPPLQKAYSELPGSTQVAIQQRMLKGDQKLDQAGANAYYGLLGKAGSDPEAFVGEDLSSYYGQMPDHMLVSLMGMQKSINAKDVAQQAKGLNWKNARSTVEDMLKPIGLGQTAKPDTTNAKTTEQFYGRLQDAMQTYHDQNGNKWPQPQDVRKMAASLLTPGLTPGSVFGRTWGDDTRAFQVDDLSKFYVPLPSGADRSNLATSFQKVMGHVPTDAELQQWYTRYKMSGGK